MKEIRFGPLKYFCRNCHKYEVRHDGDICDTCLGIFIEEMWEGYNRRKEAEAGEDTHFGQDAI